MRAPRCLRFACLLATSLGPVAALPAATASNGSTDKLLGEWRGRSLCVTTTRAACTDETVVYRIARGAGAGAFHISAQKIVGGKEAFMGDIDCSFETTRQQLLCPMGDSRWQFRWDGGQLLGGLFDAGGAVRFVQVVRAPH